MAEIEPPPPAPERASTARGTPTLAVISLSDVSPAASPADSEKTVIARVRPRKMMARPGQGAAVFSTDGGRLPRRNAPFPPPPVVVRSDKVSGVVDAANYWRKKCPDFYLCFLPTYEWGISDLWDDADIHLDSPGFLEEVLQFIMYDNLTYATAFCRDWCQLHHDEINMLGNNIDQFRDPNDELAIVNIFFTHGELDDYPREFLCHVLTRLRDTMRSYNAKYRSKEVGSSRPMPEEYAVVEEMKQQLPPVSVGPQSAFAGQPFPPPVLRPAVPNGSLVRYPSYTPGQPHKPILSQGDGLPMGHHVAMMPGHIGGQPRHTKRPARSGSNPFAQPSQMHEWGENVRMPSSEHMRHPSGPLPNGGAHRYVSPMPMGPGMMNPLHPGAQFPPNAMTSPPMHPSQMQYAQMMPQAAMFSPPVPMPPQLHDPAFQQYGLNGPGPRGGPFVDMANSLQYPPVRGVDARGLQRCNIQGMKPSGLFNPYGAERPDKAGFATTGGRKGGRGNFTNNVGRGRKPSAGPLERSGYNQYTSDYPENGMRFNSGHYVEGPQPRNTSYVWEADPSITKNMEFGCNHSWIGPKNDTVRHLFVKSLPNDITGDEIKALFEQFAGVSAVEAEVRFADNKEFLHAFVHFSSTDDARKALHTKPLTIRGHEAHVSVSRRYFTLHSRDPYSSQHQLRSTFQDAHRSANGIVTSAKPFHYSPQDARSDLHRGNRQQQQEQPAARGSPEMRKAKKSMPAKKSGSALEEQTKGGLEAEVSPTKSVYTASVDKWPTKQETPGDSQNASTSEAIVIPETSEAKVDSVAEEETSKVPTMKSVAEDEVAETSDAHQTPTGENISVASESISESIPTDSQAPLLTSPTKVALPPPAEQAQESAQDNPTVVEATEHEQAEDVAAVSQAQDETPSDDDQKNDLSFHSARESQLDTGNEDALKSLAPSDAHIEEDVPVQVATEHVQLTVPQTESAESQKKHETTTKVVPMPQDQQVKEVTPASEKSPVETAKKQGTKRTESLHPFAKPNKSQQRKEKKTKKQEKLKEKEKTKAEVVNNGEVQNKDGSMIVNDTTDEVPAPTEKDEAQESVVVQEPNKVTLDQSSTEDTSIAPSREKTNAYENLTGTTVAPTIHFAAPLSGHNQQQEPEKKVKIIPAKIAVPSLELLKKKASPTSATTPPHTAYFSVTSLTSEKPGPMKAGTEVPPASHDVEAPSGTYAPHDSASVASSSTLRGPSPPPMSVSPTAKEFHTPLQTPSALGTPGTEAAKKKKKKKKKKAVNKEEGPAEEPFHDQLSQIANTQSGYYALRGSDLPAQEILERKEDKGPRGLIRQVQAYVREKASGYSRIPESTWSKDNRKEVEKMTPSESERIMVGTRLPVSAAMHIYCQDEMMADGSPHKAGKAGAIPFYGE